MSRVYISLYGVGLGHASRMLLLANELAQNRIRMRFSSFGDAVNYIRMHGFECFDVPPVEFGWSPDSGFVVKQSIMKIPENFINFIMQCSNEAKNIARFDPRVVVSDTRLSSLIIAKMYGIPCITILNQIKLLLSPRLREFAVSRIFETMLAEFLGLYWSSSDALLIPDLPPPYTISEDNLWRISTVLKKIRYVGFAAQKPLVDDDRIEKVARALSLDGKPVVFAHISGPKVTKMFVTRKIIDALKDRDDITLIVSEGKPDGSKEAKKIRNGWYFEWCPVRDEIFASSDLLIVRGGHSTLAQAIEYGKPVVSIPIENHGEQLGNAAKAEKIGIGLMVRQKDLSNERIEDAVYTILNDRRFEDRARSLMDLARKMNGIENIAECVRSYL